MVIQEREILFAMKLKLLTLRSYNFDIVLTDNFRAGDQLLYIWILQIVMLVIYTMEFIYTWYNEEKILTGFYSVTDEVAATGSVSNFISECKKPDGSDIGPVNSTDPETT